MIEAIPPQDWQRADVMDVTAAVLTERARWEN
jgi:hypothetical protein